MLGRKIPRSLFDDSVDLRESVLQESGVASLSKAGYAHQGNVNAIKE